MHDYKRVKIVATVGPATDNFDSILKLSQAGVNVFRLNMSHGQHSNIAKIHKYIRDAETKLAHPIGILGDLQGPKLRCGTFNVAEGYDLNKGDTFNLDCDVAPGDRTRVYVPHSEIFESAKVGSNILVNDGAVRLEVMHVEPKIISCKVAQGGRISDRKGLNLPDTVLPIPALTEKDKSDLEFLCELGIDWLALSFVQRAKDIKDAKVLVSGRAKIVSKIEKPAAIECFSELLENSDAVMVARGDLGVEIPLSKVPAIQRKLIRQCRAAGKPVIVATQMLESMVKLPVPTRAEVTDVATAIYAGADAVMLSAESAMGAFAVEAVEMMGDIAWEAESDPNYLDGLSDDLPQYNDVIEDVIPSAVKELARSDDLKAICCFTQSGSTALRIARERPWKPIVALSPSIDTARHMCLVWGLISVHEAPVKRFKGAVKAALNTTQELGLASGCDKIAITAGVPVDTEGQTNILRIANVDGSDMNIED